MPLAANPKQIDHSTIPPAVKRQAAAAEEMRRRAAGEPDPQQQDGQQQLQGDPQQRFRTTVEDAPPIQPQPADGQSSPGDERPQPTNPAPQPPELPKAAQIKEGEDPNGETWHQKFVSEHGRTQRMRADLEQLTGEVSNLRGLLATVQTAQPAAQPAAQPDPQQTFKTEITPEEIEQWGPDLLVVMEKKAREIAARETADLKRQIERLGGQVQNVTNTTAVSARDQMMRTLDSTEGISGWRDINSDPEFIAWLAYPDRLSAQKRHDMLISAWNSNDASRVAAFFQQFQQEAGRAGPPPTPQQGNGAAQPQAKPSLESLAAPGKPRSSAPQQGAAAAKDIITTGDIARFYADRTAGRFKGREADADAYEREIFEAQKQGLVRAGPPSRT